MSERQLICIGCPLGCMLTATLENGTVTAVTGNTCRRGDEYARKECTTPERTVTGTVRVAGGSAGVVSVRTSAPIPKDHVTVWAEKLRTIPAPAGPIRPGQILLRDPFGMKVDILATGKH